MNLERFIEKNAPKNRIALLVVLDLLIIAVSGFLALYVRFDFSFSKMDMKYVDYELHYLPVNLILTLLIFVAFKLYRSVWHFASTTELLNVIGAGSGSILSQIHPDGTSGDADAGQLLYDEIRDPDRRNRMPALRLSDSPYVSGETCGTGERQAEKHYGSRRRRGRSHDYQRVPEQPLSGS